jgi:hypothetical protein
MTKPYTYLIGWPEHNLWYYGVRYAEDCDPSDLWISYFTSSVHVARTRAELGEPTLIAVRRTFSSHFTARSWEARVLRRMKVRLDERFINRSHIPAPPPEKHPDHVEAVAAKLRNQKRTLEQKARMSEAAKKRPSRGPCTEETKRKMSEAKKGKICTPEHCANIALASSKRIQSDEERAKRKASLTGKKKSPEHVRAVVEAKRLKRLERLAAT